MGELEHGNQPGEYGSSGELLQPARAAAGLEWDAKILRGNGEIHCVDLLAVHRLRWGDYSREGCGKIMSP